MQAIMNGVICKRVNPTHWEGSRFIMPEKYRKRTDFNNWVEVVSVGPGCMEDLKPGDKVLIGNNCGTPFAHEQVDYVLIWGSKQKKGQIGWTSDVLLRSRDGKTESDK